MTNLDLTGAETHRLVQTLGAWPTLTAARIVVLGAAELALALNDLPHLRHLFVGDGRLCTLEWAELELKGAYAGIGSPAFVNRESELKAIQAFLEDPGRRVLQVSGPRYSGKTRLVIEALRPSGSGVVWASSPEVATWELFRDLDTETGPAVLVIDRCETAARDVLERARGQQRLKTLVVRERQVDGPEALSVGPLGRTETRRLAEAVLPRGAFLQQTWLTDAADGSPGLLLHVAALVRARPRTRDGDPEQMAQRLDSLLEEAYVAGLDPAMRRSLQVIALLAPLGVEGEGIAKERDAVCGALEVSQRDVEAHLEELVRRGLVRRRGRFAEVVPPLLARRLAATVLSSAPRIVAELVTALDPGAMLRFLDRFGDLPGEPVRRAAEELLSEWFPDLNSLLTRAPQFERLAPAAPRAAARYLERLLDPVSVEDVRTTVEREGRVALVFALEDLALRTDTFAIAAWHLLLFAAAENESRGNNELKVFTGLFSWRHPEVTTPLSARAAVLERGMREPSGAKRAAVARACGASFRERESFTLHSPKGPGVPDEPYRPGTWDEVREYAARVMAILDALLRDADSSVQSAARASVLETSRSILILCMGPDGLKVPGRYSLELLAEIGRAADTASLRAKMVSHIELLVNWLGEAPRAEWPPVAELRRGLDSVLGELTGQSFKHRLERAVGPASWALKLKRDDIPQLVDAVARELVMQPKLLRDHLEWLLGDEARRRRQLFGALGRTDAGGELFHILRHSVVKGDSWAEAFAAYVRGWAASDGGEADGTLDRLLNEQPDIWQGVVRASGEIGPSTRGLERLLRILQEPPAPRQEVEREVVRSVRWTLLDDAAAERLIAELERGGKEMAGLLIDALAERAWGRDGQLSANLQERAWRFLAESYPALCVRPGELCSWDTLAASLGQRHPDRLLTLLKEQVLPVVLDGAQALGLEGSLPLVWDTLRAQRREGLVQAVLVERIKRARNSVADRTLSQLLDLSKDWELVQEILDSQGARAAEAIALHVEANDPGFWKLAEMALRRWGKDGALRRQLRTTIMMGPWSGSPLPMVEALLKQARALAAHADPDIASWAREAVEELEAWRERELHQNQEEWIWDYRIRRSELEAMVRKKESPAWRWAVARLLKDAPADRVRELLTPEEILEVLPTVPDLDARRRQMWEAWARHWRQAG